MTDPSGLGGRFAHIFDWCWRMFWVVTIHVSVPLYVFALVSALRLRLGR